MTMSAKVLLFGKLRDAFGADAVAMPEGVESVRDLRIALGVAHPHLAALVSAPSVRVAVNQELVADEITTLIGPDDEVALLPPLSGG